RLCGLPWILRAQVQTHIAHVASCPPRFLRRASRIIERLSGEATMRKVTIIGSGPAGLTAAIYAARANLSPTLIEGGGSEKSIPGGQLMITTDVENYPGFPDGVQGPEMMELFRRQAVRFGTEMLSGDVTRVDLSQRPFRLWIGDEVVESSTLIVATGASAKWLGMDEERPWPAGLGGRGLSACATCDGFFFRDKDVAVIGGGDTAM